AASGGWSKNRATKSADFVGPAQEVHERRHDISVRCDVVHRLSRHAGHVHQERNLDLRFVERARMTEPPVFEEFFTMVAGHHDDSPGDVDLADERSEPVIELAETVPVTVPDTL